LLQYKRQLRRRKYKREKKPYWRTNENIRAEKVRVVASDGKQLGVMAPREALEAAKKEKLDLVEIAPKAKPPVVQIVNFGKFKYTEEKKRKKSKKGAKTGEVKEVRFSPFIGEADYQTRLGRANGFLNEGNKVRAVVKFKGRQMGSKQFGYDLMKRLLGDVETTVVVDMKPKFLGRHLAMVISPTNKSTFSKKTENENEKDKDKTKDKKVSIKTIPNNQKR